ncbi:MULTISPECIES: vanadium-dependent haloperoxidase [Saccharothrix]|uniref:vanadium-dependent haloperoxidase n=1 Tax=Saccharothrix TaxID=2071 RepID=UPI0009F894F2|nr:vanadium-dependent haloperoxidase [Saccharothrix sp. CB00851]
MSRSTARRRLGLVAVTTLAFGGTLGGLVQPAVAAPASDPVLYWNDVLLQTYREVGGAPGPLARGGAMVHAAIYDAVNSITTTGQPYVYKTEAAGASVTHAIAHAAHDTLTAAFPGVDFTDELAGALAGAGSDTGNGTGVGKAAAAAMISARANDGSDDNTPYTAGTEPGYWRPTGSGQAATPNWGKVKPFTMTSGSQHRPPLPAGYSSMSALLASPEYAAQFTEVREYGKKSSHVRTPDQTQAAHFWANDLDGTYKPPGQLFEHTQIVAEQRGLGTAAKARLFALVGLAMGDAGIVAWDAKYQTDIDLWRPETAIAQAEHDGNPDTHVHTTWHPLSKDRNGVPFSPPFPAYTSGHATFGGAWAGAMRSFFGTDDISFTATTEDPHAVGVTRTFPSFTAAARENALSRVYLGVHFRFDGENGVASGQAMAESAAARFVRGAGTANAAVISCSFADIHKTYDNGQLKDFLVSTTRDQAVSVHFSSSDGGAHYSTVNGRTGWISSECVRFFS